MSGITDSAWIDANGFFGRLAGRLALANPELWWRTEQHRSHRTFLYIACSFSRRFDKASEDGIAVSIEFLRDGRHVVFTCDISPDDSSGLALVRMPPARSPVTEDADAMFSVWFNECLTAAFEFIDANIEIIATAVA